MHETTATMALGLMFAVVRKLIRCDRAVRTGRWTDREPFLNPGLDVLADEPPDPGNPLLSMEQVVFSPHVGGDTERTMVRAVDVACRNVPIFLCRVEASLIRTAANVPHSR